jgi:hypothetical protein
MRCRAEDGEPSPLLPAWLELPLHPVRSQASKGLKGGASPLLLPAAADRRQRQGGTDAGGGSDDDGSELRGGVMPSAGVLRRSEFLLPIDDQSAEIFNAALRPPGRT